MSDGFHLAQINVARLLAPLDDPRLRDFTDNLGRINAIAEAAPGFVWRLKGEGGDATDLVAFDDPSIVVNVSVWTDLGALGAFVYRSGHVEIMRRRREFFEPPAEAFMALWWIAAGAVPSLGQAVERLQHLRRHGPTPYAFGFRRPFPPEAGAAPVAPILDRCA